MTAIKQLNRADFVHQILYLDVVETAYLLRVDPATVRRYVKNGSLEAIQLPRNPQTVDEANGKVKVREAKRGYRIKKALVAKFLSISVDELNNHLSVYYQNNPSRKERNQAKQKAVYVESDHDFEYEYEEEEA